MVMATVDRYPSLPPWLTCGMETRNPGRSRHEPRFTSSAAGAAPITTTLPACSRGSMGHGTTRHEADGAAGASKEEVLAEGSLTCGSGWSLVSHTNEGK